MSNFRAAVSGNSSNIATWEYYDGSNWVAAIALPQLGDIVYANGYTVTFDANMEASEWRTDSIVDVTAGGSFVFGSASEIIGDCYAGGANCVTNSTSTQKVIVGNTYGSTTASSSSIDLAGCYNTGSGGIMVVGDSIGGSGTRCFGFRVNNGNNIITGTALGGSSLVANRTDLSPCGLYATGGNFTVGTAIARQAFGVGVKLAVGTVNTVARYDNGLDGVLAFQCDSGVGTVNNIYNEVDSDLLIRGFANLSSTEPVTVSLSVPLDDGTKIAVDYLPSTANYPSEADVKDGVVYGNSDQFEGTLEQVDVAQLATDLAEEIRTSAEPEFVRLRNCQTSEINQQQLTATLGG